MPLFPIDGIPVLQGVILLLAANGAPIIASKIFGSCWQEPIDAGIVCADQRRLLGDTKTWRGLFGALALAAGMAIPLGLNALTGLLFGALTMLGDLLASFLKRRRGYVESSRARGFDTVPESLLPTWLLKEHLHLELSGVVLTVLIFFLIEEFVSPILYRLHIRKRPY